MNMEKVVDKPQGRPRTEPFLRALEGTNTASVFCGLLASRTGGGGGLVAKSCLTLATHGL